MVASWAPPARNSGTRITVHDRYTTGRAVSVRFRPFFQLVLQFDREPRQRYVVLRRPSLAVLLGAGQLADEPRRCAEHPRRRSEHVRHPRDCQLQVVAGGTSASDVDVATGVHWLPRPPAARLRTHLPVPVGWTPAYCDGQPHAHALTSLLTLTCSFRLPQLIRHRGPDGSGINLIENADGTCSAIAHERLAIVDPLAGNQPLYSKVRAGVALTLSQTRP